MPFLRDQQRDMGASDLCFDRDDLVSPGYRPLHDANLIVVFVTAALAEGTKQRSREALTGILSKKEANQNLRNFREPD